MKYILCTLSLLLLALLTIPSLYAEPWPNADPSGPWTPTPVTSEDDGGSDSAENVSSLIAHYPFSETSGNRALDIARGNHAEITGSAWRTPGQSGNALHLHDATLFAAGRDYLDLQPGDFSISFWLRRTAKPADQPQHAFVIERRHAFGFCVDFPDAPGCDSGPSLPLESGWYVSVDYDPRTGRERVKFVILRPEEVIRSMEVSGFPAVAPMGKWRHYRVTYSAETFSLFADDQLISTVETTDLFGLKTPLDTPLKIKGHGYDVDELKIELTSAVEDNPTSDIANTNCTVAASTPMRYVDRHNPLATDVANSCTDATKPCLTIQHAIDVAQPNEAVRVANGWYQERIDFKGKPITVASDFAWTGERADIHSTLILARDEAGSAVTLANGEGNTSQLIGFTLTGGTGTLLSDTGYSHTSYAARRGGGIFLNRVEPMLCDLIVTGNSAEIGGGIFSLRSQPTISGTIIMENEATSTRNDGGGGGIYFESHARYQPRIINSLIHGNEARNGGGIYTNYSTQLTLLHATIADNVATDGGGILRHNGSVITMTNSIVWGNRPATSEWATEDGRVTHSIVESLLGQDGRLVDGVLGVDPLFSADYRLSANSPAIDSGTQTNITHDLTHAPRHAPADMGAYEYVPTESATLKNHYAFEESGAQVVDTTGRRDGKLIGNFARTAGRSGNAVLFKEGGSLYVENPYTIAEQFSFSLWLRFSHPDAGGSGAFTFMRSDETGRQFLLTEHNHALDIYAGDDSVCRKGYGATQRDNQWHHVVVTINLSTRQAHCYLDGNLHRTAALQQSNLADIPTSAPLSIYGRGYMVDEVQLYDGILSQTQVTQLYTQP